MDKVGFTILLGPSLVPAHTHTHQQTYKFLFLHFSGCATSVLVATAQMGEMSMQVLVGSVSTLYVIFGKPENFY